MITCNHVTSELEQKGGPHMRAALGGAEERLRAFLCKKLVGLRELVFCGAVGPAGGQGGQAEGAVGVA